MQFYIFILPLLSRFSRFDKLCNRATRTAIITVILLQFGRQQVGRFFAGITWFYVVGWEIMMSPVHEFPDHIPDWISGPWFTFHQLFINQEDKKAKPCERFPLETDSVVIWTPHHVATDFGRPNQQVLHMRISFLVVGLRNRSESGVLSETFKQANIDHNKQEGLASVFSRTT